MNYKELYNQILEKTDNFKQTNGVIKLSSKNDLDIAFNILSQMYKNVKKVGLDYSNKEQGSLDYKISYNNYKDINNDIDDLAEHVASKYIGESLEKATPYMLRNDGKLIKCELKYGNYHPYILNVYDIDSDIKSLVFDRFSELEWFYNNTNNKNVKEYISIIYHSLTGDNYFNDSDYIVKDDELKQFAIALNNEVNNEFCRVRTSNVKYGGDSNDIYFRISSIGFNWFPLI